MGRVPTIQRWLEDHPSPPQLNAAAGDTAWGTIRFDREPRRHLHLRASVLHVPLREGYFSSVVLADAIEHLPAGSEPRALSELRRVLRPGGWLLLSAPNDRPWLCWTDPAYWWLGHRHYTAVALSRLVKEAGFRVQRSGTTGNPWTETMRIWLNLLTYPFRRIVSHGHPPPLEGRWPDPLRDDDGGYTVFVIAERSGPTAAASEAPSMVER
jgi:SAM-dependent methyltransferase